MTNQSRNRKIAVCFLRNRKIAVCFLRNRKIAALMDDQNRVSA